MGTKLDMWDEVRMLRAKGMSYGDHRRGKFRVAKILVLILKSSEVIPRSNGKE